MKNLKRIKNNNTLPLVSIITVVKNGDKVLENTIKSVINQTYPEIDYIIIDGASKDKTLEIIKKYENHISKWISEPDKSLYDGMNKGLKLAKGEYVWFINAGDKIYDDSTLEKAFEKRDGDVYYGETVFENLEGKKIGPWWHKTPDELTWKKMNRGMLVCHQSFIIRKSLVTEYDLKYKVSSDFDWMIKGLKKSNKIINTKLILSRFLAGGFSKKHEFASWVDNYHILKKNFGFWRNFINQIFMAVNRFQKILFSSRPRT